MKANVDEDHRVQRVRIEREWKSKIGGRLFKFRRRQVVFVERNDANDCEAKEICTEILDRGEKASPGETTLMIVWNSLIVGRALCWVLPNFSLNHMRM